MVYRCIKNNGKLGEISGKPYDCLVSPIFARDTRRIGGLETLRAAQGVKGQDTRRIGGLESIPCTSCNELEDTRRIGGLEMYASPRVKSRIRYPPYRRFRDQRRCRALAPEGYPPYRRFRDGVKHIEPLQDGYPPYRRFREMPSNVALKML